MRKSAYIVALLLLVIGLVGCNKEEIDHDEFTFEPTSDYIAVFGDIQYYTYYKGNTRYYQHSLDWISRKLDEGCHFNCVLHTGDLTEKNELEGWNRFSNAIGNLATKIPCYSVIGDHDYERTGARILDRKETHFNEFVQFPLSTQKVVAWFEEGRMENVVVENTIHGQRLDLLILEFGPRSEVIKWANAYVKAHPDHLFIVMNHEYLEYGGGRRTSTTRLKCVMRLRNTTYNTPEQLWDRLIKSNDNIRAVLCGHVESLYALTVEENDFGREIPQIQHNIQGDAYLYDNWLMIWEFPIDSDMANVCIYSTRKGKYYDDKKVLFQFKYRDVI